MADGSADDDRIPPTPATGFFSFVPGLWTLRHYRANWLAKDVVAGLVLTALLVPAGMGYAEAAGLPAVNGLYATVIPLLAYAVFGPSRIMVLGPDSALAALVAAAVLAPAASSIERATSLAAMLAILTGAFSVLAGLLRAGAMTDLISKPVRVGYMNGIAITILSTQLPKLLGFTGGTSSLLRGMHAMTLGPVNLGSLAVGASSLFVILLLRRLAPKVPGVLVAVCLATIAVTLLPVLATVSVVGPVPRGIPLPAIPVVALADVGPLVVAAMGIALVSFADTSVLSRTYAARTGYRVDPNRELIGLGLANVAAGFFHGFPVSSSSSRTPVAESAGSRTQLTGVVGALTILLLLIAAPGLTQNVPIPALAAVVISAALSLIDFRALQTFFRVRRSDFLVSMLAFLGVAALGVIPGIGLAVGMSIVDFVRRAWRPHDAVLGRVRGVKGYHDMVRHPEARQVPGLVLFRWDAPLFFANADQFRLRVLDAVERAQPDPAAWVVIAAGPITDVDTTAAETVQELEAELAASGVRLAFAEMKGPVKDRLQRYGLKQVIGHEFFFPTVGVAVRTFLDQHAVEWDDEPTQPRG